VGEPVVSIVQQSAGSPETAKGNTADQPHSEATNRADGASTSVSAWPPLPQWLPSMEDARKFVVNALIVVIAILSFVVVLKAGLTRATVIETISVPRQLEDRGYTAVAVAQRIIDEITDVDRVASTLKAHGAFSSVPLESKLPKIDLPVGGISLATFVSQFRELLGITDTKIIGEIVVESVPAASVAEKEEKQPLKFSLRLRIMDKGTVFKASEPTAKLDALIQHAAVRVVERFDPYTAAAYYYVNEDYENALRMVQASLNNEIKEDRPWALNLRALTARVQKRYDEAIAEFNNVIENFPHFLGARYNLAQALIDKGQTETFDRARGYFEEARKVALEGVKVDKTKRGQAIGYTIVGIALHRISVFDETNYDKALGYFDRSIAADPKYAMAYFHKGEVYRDRKPPLPDKAIAMFRLASEIDPANPDIYETYTSWGVLVRGLGQREEAGKLFVAAIAANPKRADAYNLVGTLYLDQREWEKAGEFFHKAMDADPNWPRPHYNLGRALRGAGKLDQAIAAFEKAIALDPLDALSYVHSGGTLAEAARQKKGKPATDLTKEAIRKLTKAREIAPQDSEVLREVGRTYEILNLPEPAREANQAANEIDGGEYHGAGSR
jgi:tetratricopeptide (TPR) repeat protein